MQLRHPEVLLLAIPLMALTLLALRWSLVGLSRRRMALATAARLLLVLALAAVAAELRLVLPHTDRATVFVVDVSESVSPTGRRHLQEWVRSAWKGHRPGDRAGVVIFARDARPEVALSKAFEFREPSLEGLARDRTAIDRGLRAGVSLLRDAPGERRVVLLSDGNASHERAEREARALASAGVRLDTVAVPLEPSPGEVLLGDVSAPPIVSEGQPFLIDVEVTARRGGPALLHVVRNGRYLSPQRVALSPGLNRVPVEQRLDEADVFTYEVWIEASGDGNTSNNRGGAIVRVRGRPRVLLVLGSEVDPDGVVTLPGREVAAPLARALRAGGFDVTARGEAGLPLNLSELASFDAFVFGNVDAGRWSPEQMEAVRRYVFEQGGGLVALGGPRSYGLGGYYRTPVEAALPLNSDVRGKKVLPALGLVLCIDRSGSMSAVTGGASNLDLAKEGATRSLELLQPFDQVGVAAFDQSVEWAVELQPVENRARLKGLVRGISLGGGTAIGNALNAALERLQRAPVQIKHVVLLTDGRSDEPAVRVRELTRAYQEAGITLTTVGVGDGVDATLLREYARATGGRYLEAKDPRALPRLLSKEAVTASQALLIERSLVPRHRGGLQALGIDWRRAPPLLGYVLTAAKPRAEVLLDTGPGEELEDGPILARWRYGLGKSVAFASDGTLRWGKRWVDWKGYDQLFGSLVRWVAREPQAPGYTTKLELSEGEARLEVSVRDPRGVPIDGLKLGANLSGPADSGTIPRTALRPVGPGRYVGTAEVQRPGAYFATVDREQDGKSQPVGNAGAVLAYPREYRHLRHDQVLLDRLAELGGGEALTLDDDPKGVFAGERTTRFDYRPLAWLLLPLAGLLLLAELCARRLVVPESLRTGWTSWREARAGRTAASGETLRTLRDRKLSEREAVAARSARVKRARSDRQSRSSGGGTASEPSGERPPRERKQENPKAAPKPEAPKPSPQPSSKPAPRPAPKADADEPTGSMSKLLKAKRQARARRRKDSDDA